MKVISVANFLRDAARESSLQHIATSIPELRKGDNANLNIQSPEPKQTLLIPENFVSSAAFINARSAPSVPDAQNIFEPAQTLLAARAE